MRNTPAAKLLAVLCGVALIVGSSFAYAKLRDANKVTAEFGCPAPDSVFIYDIISRVTLRPNEFRVLGSDAVGCQIHSSTWGDYNWAGGLTPYIGPNKAVEAKLAQDLWPLRVGNHVEKRGEDFCYDFDVLSYGDVTVPAGTFKAFKIVKSYWYADRRTLVAVWWSPRLRWIIKQRSAMMFGPPPRSGFNDWALAGMSLPSNSPTFASDAVTN